MLVYWLRCVVVGVVAIVLVSEWWCCWAWVVLLGLLFGSAVVVVLGLWNGVVVGYWLRQRCDNRIVVERKQAL